MRRHGCIHLAGSQNTHREFQSQGCMSQQGPRRTRERSGSKPRAGNVLRAKFAAGLFDGQALADLDGSKLVNSAAAQQLAYQTAVESAVLLHNLNNTLPLKLGPGGVTKIAVVPAPRHKNLSIHSLQSGQPLSIKNQQRNDNDGSNSRFSFA